MLVRHPPDPVLADVLAMQGATILPSLLERIRTEERDVVRTDLLLVALRIQELGTFSIGHDPEAMAVLRVAVSSMKDEQWQEDASEIVRKIRDLAKPENKPERKETPLD